MMSNVQVGEQASTLACSNAFEALVTYLDVLEAPDPKRAAGAILRDFGSVSNLLSSPISRVERSLGGETARITFAAYNLFQSSLLEQLVRGPVIAGRKEVVRFLQSLVGSLRHERLIALFLDSRLHLMRLVNVSEGTYSGTSLEIPRLVRLALECGASNILLVHNHPSGDPTPSRSDIIQTNRLARIAADLDMRLVDHLIFAGGEIRSLMDGEPLTQIGNCEQA